MHDRLVRLSKYLAKYLRHAPHELGLTLQPGGWVPVDDLLSAARRRGFPISYDDLAECVETQADEEIKQAVGKSVRLLLTLVSPHLRAYALALLYIGTARRSRLPLRLRPKSSNFCTCLGFRSSQHRKSTVSRRSETAMSQVPSISPSPSLIC